MSGRGQGNECPLGLVVIATGRRVVKPAGRAQADNQSLTQERPMPWPYYLEAISAHGWTDG